MSFHIPKKPFIPTNKQILKGRERTLPTQFPNPIYKHTSHPHQPGELFGPKVTAPPAYIYISPFCIQQAAVPKFLQRDQHS